MTEPASTGAVQRFFGLVLIVMSALWIAFCGLCGFWMITMMFQSQEFTIEAIGSLLLVLGLSGGGAAAGYALLVVGRGLAK